MNKLFKIKYEVDTGYEYRRDIALVKAYNETEAEKRLKEYIGKIGNEYAVSEIFEVKEFNADIFTRIYG